MEISTELRVLVVRSKKSKKTIAKECNMPASKLSKILSGSQSPVWDDIISISSACGFDTDISFRDSYDTINKAYK